MLQPYKSFVMVCARKKSTNHAKPSLCSGADLKVKLMLGGRLRRQALSEVINLGELNAH